MKPMLTSEKKVLESVFGEQKMLTAKINEMSLVDHKILLEHF